MQTGQGWISTRVAGSRPLLSDLENHGVLMQSDESSTDPVTPRTGIASHEGQAFDRRRNEMERGVATTVAECLQRDPPLVQEGLRWLDDTERNPSFGPSDATQEWRERIAIMPLADLLEFLVAETTDALRLRPSNPFMRIISPEQRREIYARVG